MFVELFHFRAEGRKKNKMGSKKNCIGAWTLFPDQSFWQLTDCNQWLDTPQVRTLLMQLKIILAEKYEFVVVKVEFPGGSEKLMEGHLSSIPMTTRP